LKSINGKSKGKYKQRVSHQHDYTKTYSQRHRKDAQKTFISEANVHKY